MSTTPSSLSALPASAGTLWSNWAFSLLALTILYYDWILTLPDEITHLWRKPSARGVLPMFCFFVLRYFALFGHAAIAVEFFSLSISAETCEKLQTLHQSLICVLQLFSALTLLLRLNAVYRKRSVLIFLCTIIVATIIFAVWALIIRPAGEPRNQFLVGAGTTLPGCNPLVTEKESHRIAAVWACMLIYEVAVFVLLLAKGFQEHWRAPATLWHTLLLDGALYFLAIGLSNVANIVCYLTAPPVIKGTLGTLTNVLSSALVCRLVIHLRVAAARISDHRMRAAVGSELRFVSPAEYRRGSLLQGMSPAQSPGGDIRETWANGTIGGTAAALGLVRKKHGRDTHEEELEYRDAAHTSEYEAHDPECKAAGEEDGYELEEFVFTATGSASSSAGPSSSHTHVADPELGVLAEGMLADSGEMFDYAHLRPRIPPRAEDRPP
ncbi:hypothetical protein PENSPDRAFT_660033 [Peniophora sp. CONT]|nr:hypothetical protein PENSPDRAFT_660033 [Peniophora sp. CONT]